jgi:hypothetical protein
MTKFYMLLSLVVLSGCMLDGGFKSVDSGPSVGDGAQDSEVDGGMDPLTDAQVDLGVDANTTLDAGPIDYSGAFMITPPPTKMCAAAGVNYTLSTMRFTSIEGMFSMVMTENLSDPLNTMRTLTGTMDTEGNFNAIYRSNLPGMALCIWTYQITGTFTDSDNFTGTWISDYSTYDPAGTYVEPGCGALTTDCALITRVSVMGARSEHP